MRPALLREEGLVVVLAIEGDIFGQGTLAAKAEETEAVCIRHDAEYEQGVAGRAGRSSRCVDDCV